MVAENRDRDQIVVFFSFHLVTRDNAFAPSFVSPTTCCKCSSLPNILNMPQKHPRIQIGDDEHFYGSEFKSTPMNQNCFHEMSQRLNWKEQGVAIYGVGSLTLNFKRVK